MPQIKLRIKAHTKSAEDLVVNVQDATFEYLMSSTVSEIRVSTYFDRDWPRVEAEYAEIFVNDECQFESRIVKVIPGSRTRSSISLPGEMKEGEQLIVIVARGPRVISE
ncbi:MAG: hypothetical protein ABIQ95_03635 [Bdellovibrionia bacterium]